MRRSRILVRVGALAGIAIAVFSALLVLSGSAAATPIDDAGSAPVALNYTALGDSITYGRYAGDDAYVIQYKNDIDLDLHAATVLTNLGVAGWTSANLLNAVTINPTFRSSISDADVITVFIGLNDFLAARAQYLDSTCGGADNEDCFRAMVATYHDNLAAILSELGSLNTKPDLLLRLSELYYPALGNPATGSANAIYVQYIKQMNQLIHTLADEHGYRVALVLRAFNGEQGDEDALANGLLLPDGIHPSVSGFTAIAGEFRSPGYAPLDADADGVVERFDNCPGLANSDQKNFNSEVIHLPRAVVSFDDYTNPIGDNVGDACDNDVDHDGLSNVTEAALGTDPRNADSDGDRVLDSAEVRCGSNPLDAGSTPIRPNGVTLADVDDDQLPDSCEAAFGTTVGSRDSDHDRIMDGVEALYLGTAPTVQDSDGDGCRDDLEMASVDGDRSVRMNDIIAVLRAYGTRAGDSLFVANFDMNGDGIILMLDMAVVASHYGGDCP